MRRLFLAAMSALAALAAFAACGFDGQGTGSGAGDGAGGAAGNGGASEGGTTALADATAGDAPDGENVGLDDGSSVDAPADSITPVVTAGDALQFSGNDYVEIGALAIPSDFTLEAWIRRHNSAAETYVMAKDRSGQSQGQFRFGVDATGRLFFLMTDSASNDHGLYNGDYVLASPAVLAVASWVHVAVTKSGAVFTLFVDGTSVDTFTASSSFTAGGPPVSFRIGGRVGSDNTSLSGGFAGTIDEVRVWKVARTQAQIAAAMKTPIPAGSAAFASLAGSWRFDEGAGTTTADATGMLPGTLVAGPTWVTSTAY